MSVINVKPMVKKVLEMSGVLKLISIEEKEETKIEKCI